MNSKIHESQDCGCDPLGDGRFRMVPSGAIVDRDESERRLAHTRRPIQNDCLGMSWAQLERMQGGKLDRA